MDRARGHHLELLIPDTWAGPCSISVKSERRGRAARHLLETVTVAIASFLSCSGPAWACPTWRRALGRRLPAGATAARIFAHDPRVVTATEADRVCPLVHPRFRAGRDPHCRGDALMASSAMRITSRVPRRPIRQPPTSCIASTRARESPPHGAKVRVLLGRLHQVEGAGGLGNRKYFKRLRKIPRSSKPSEFVAPSGWIDALYPPNSDRFRRAGTVSLRRCRHPCRLGPARVPFRSCPSTALGSSTRAAKSTDDPARHDARPHGSDRPSLVVRSRVRPT